MVLGSVWGEGAEVRAPMAITVMGGLIFSTLLTLVFIPVVYELVDRKVYAADTETTSDQDEATGAVVRPGWQPSMGDS
jgi:HAE1 family hydrophobic/amphiphilic exporter-1